MLKSLYIKDVALIDEVRISFNEGFNVFTGETGAGKSILIDSIGLILGNKADKSIIKEGAKNAKVEAIFEVCEDNSIIFDLLKELGIEEDYLISLTRVLNDNGRSEYRINGEICTLNVFKKMSNQLLDIFGQNDNQQLLDYNNHILFFDNYIGNDIENFKNELSIHLKKLGEVNKEINSLCSDSYLRAREIDLLAYEIKQIEEANFRVGEDEELLNKKNLLANSEKVHKALSQCLDNLSGTLDVATILKQSSLLLNSISGMDESIDDCKSRLESVRWEVEDVVSSIESSFKLIDFDEREIEKIEERLDLINDYKRKYGKTIEEILNYLYSAKDRLETLTNCDSIMDELVKEKEEILNKIYNLSVRMHEVRVNHVETFENHITAELRELGMQNAKFMLRFNFYNDIQTIESKVNCNGLDNIEFLFSANLGQNPKELNKIISGGELSRFCLAFKAVINVNDKGKTLIFDEIDAGIGGNTGSVVAKKIAKISKRNQVLCITHLAQIASFADTHFKIIKREENLRTYTNIYCLQSLDKEQEISRMIGVINSSNYAKLHSKELLLEANKYKMSL